MGLARLLAACVLVVLASETRGTEVPEPRKLDDAPDDALDWLDGTDGVSLKHEVPVLIAATIIVASGVCVEKAQRWLLRWVSPNTVPVVHALFREVSLLGVVALMFFVADRSGVLRSLSEVHFGDPNELGEVTQSVDLALFMTILAFLLLVVLLLLRAGRRTARTWHDHETSARYPAGLVALYEQRSKSLRRRLHGGPAVTSAGARRAGAGGQRCCGGRCARSSRCCCCRSIMLKLYRVLCRPCCRRCQCGPCATMESEMRLEAAEERLVYAALRARFLVRQSAGRVARKERTRRGNVDHGLDMAAHTGGIVVLREPEDQVFRERGTIHATKLMYPITIGVGEAGTKGKPGDWMITDDSGGVGVMPAAVFAMQYEPAEGEAGRYRKSRRVLARYMPVAYTATSSAGDRTPGRPNTYLVQDAAVDDGYTQAVVAPADFMATYERLVPEAQELVDSEDPPISTLPSDFDFGLYLSTVYAKTVAHIVELDWPAWVAVQVVLLILWGIHVVLAEAVIAHVAAAGYVLMGVALVVWRKLHWARRMLTAMDAVRQHRQAQHADPSKPIHGIDAFVSIGVSSLSVEPSRALQAALTPKVGAPVGAARTAARAALSPGAGLPSLPDRPASLYGRSISDSSQEDVVGALPPAALRPSKGWVRGQSFSADIREINRRMALARSSLSPNSAGSQHATGGRMSLSPQSTFSRSQSGVSPTERAEGVVCVTSPSTLGLDGSRQLPPAEWRGPTVPAVHEEATLVLGGTGTPSAAASQQQPPPHEAMLRSASSIDSRRDVNADLLPAPAPGVLDAPQVDMGDEADDDAGCGGGVLGERGEAKQHSRSASSTASGRSVSGRMKLSGVVAGTQRDDFSSAQLSLSAPSSRSAIPVRAPVSVHAGAGGSGATQRAKVEFTLPAGATYGNSIRGFVESSRAMAPRSLYAHTAAKLLAMRIRQQVRRAKNEQVASLATPTALTDAMDKPPFEAMPLRQAGYCACCCCCRPAGLCKPTSRQQQLLWCGSAGVRVTTVIIQLLLLLCSVFVSVGITMLITEDGPCWPGYHTFPVSLCAVWTLICAIPPTLVMALVPSIVSMFAVVTNVEEMVKPDAIREVIQTQYTTQAMRALRMLSALALNAASGFHKDAARSSPAHRGLGATPRGGAIANLKRMLSRATPSPTSGLHSAAEAVYGERDSADYVRRRAEVLDVFGLFDRELKGYITVDNMRSLLKQLGVRHMTEELLLDMMKSLDLNGDGHIGFDVFFEWIARQDRKVSDDSASSSVTAFMFGLIDTDGVGFVTVDSLRHALSCLGAFVRYDDLTRMMLVFDTSDTGQLSLPDFKRLLKEQNKFNKWLM